MLRQILPINSFRLRLISQPIDLSAGVPEEIKALAQDMLETSRVVGGAGMAAIQVGEPVRLFVMDFSHRGGDTIAFINPEVTYKSEEQVIRKEGCLSMPEVFAMVSRAAEIILTYTDLDGNPQTYQATGLEAMCCQHEMDHLNGTVYLDLLTPLRREIALKQFQKHLRQKAMA